MGTPLAWQLASAGMRTLVIDSNASVGQGSNKNAIGGIRATHSDPAKIQICLKSIEIFSSWKYLYGDDIGWLQGGYAFVAYHSNEEKVLKKLLIVQKSLGLNIEWYDKDSFLRIIPALNSEGLLGGTFSPGDGSASPMLSALAFERQAKVCGAKFHYKERSRRILCRNAQVMGIETDRDTYSAGMVINAAGGWARELAATAGVDLPVYPDSHEAGITEPVAHFLGPMIVDIHPLDPAPGQEGSANYYFYQHHTGQVIFCITPNPQKWGTDQRETSKFLPQVSTRMLKIMPKLKNLKVRRTWRGLYPMTPDGNPIIGEVEGIKGYLNAAGMCGQGFMLGPGLAYYLRCWITREGTADALQILAPLTLERDFGKKEALK